jgi:hypothetical protein
VSGETAPGDLEIVFQHNRGLGRAS